MNSAQMTKGQRVFVMATAVILIPFTLTMLGWLLVDAGTEIHRVNQRAAVKVLAEPMVWHKVGEVLLIVPFGLALAGGFVFWRSSLRRQYLRITTPLMVLGGVLNFMAAWGFYQEPRTSFTAFMVGFGPVLGLLGLAAPLLLRWIHAKRTVLERQPAGDQSM